MEAGFTQKAHSDWKSIQDCLNGTPIRLDGESLTIPQVIAVSL